MHEAPDEAGNHISSHPAQYGRIILSAGATVGLGVGFVVWGTLFGITWNVVGPGDNRQLWIYSVLSGVLAFFYGTRWVEEGSRRHESPKGAFDAEAYRSHGIRAAIFFCFAILMFVAGLNPWWQISFDAVGATLFYGMPLLFGTAYELWSASESIRIGVPLSSAFTPAFNSPRKPALFFALRAMLWLIAFVAISFTPVSIQTILGVALIVAGTLTGLMTFIYERDRQVDIYENGFVYIYRDQAIGGTWDDVDEVHLSDDGLSVRLRGSESMEFSRHLTRYWGLVHLFRNTDINQRQGTYRRMLRERRDRLEQIRAPDSPIRDEKSS
jgi:hypothetical protein